MATVRLEVNDTQEVNDGPFEKREERAQLTLVEDDLRGLKKYQVAQLAHAFVESTGESIDDVPSDYVSKVADPSNPESAETTAQQALESGDESFQILFNFVALHHLRISSDDTSIAYSELLEAHPWWGKVVKEQSDLHSDIDYDALPTAPVSLFGKQLNFPLGFASTNIPGKDHLAQFADCGFDLISTRTYRCDAKAHPPHPAPNVAVCHGETLESYSLDDRPTVKPTFDPTYRPKGLQPGLVHSIGAPGATAEDIRHEIQMIRMAVSRKGQMLSVSIYGDGNTNWRELAMIAFDEGADAVELNLSLPTVEEGMFFERREDCAKVIAEVRGVADSYEERKYVAAKIGYLPEDRLREWFTACHELLDAIFAINGVKVSAVSSGTDDSGEGVAFFPERKADLAALSGPPIFNLALEVVDNLRKLREEAGRSSDDLPIIASGGVSNYEQFVAMLDAGAYVVQCCSGAWYEPELARTIRKRPVHRKSANATPDEQSLPKSHFARFRRLGLWFRVSTQVFLALYAGASWNSDK